MRFDEFDGLGPVAGLCVCRAERSCLTRRDGRVDALRTSVGAGPDAVDDGIDVVAVAFGVLDPLEREHAEPLTEHGAVGLVGERSDLLGLGQGGRLREAHVHEDVVHCVDAARDDEVAVTEVQLVDSHRDRGERRGARSVRDAVRAAEVEAVGDASGHDVAEQAREGRLLPRHEVVADAVADGRDVRLGHAVFAKCIGPDRTLEAAAHVDGELGRRGDAEDDAGAGLVQRRVVGFSRPRRAPLARGHQGQELRRVGRFHHRRRYAEFQGVECDLVDEAAAVAVGLVRRGGIGVVIVRRVPVVGGNVADRIFAAGDGAPEPGGSALAREHRCHPDDGHLRRHFAAPAGPVSASVCPVAGHPRLHRFACGTDGVSPGSPRRP